MRLWLAELIATYAGTTLWDFPKASARPMEEGIYFDDVRHPLNAVNFALAQNLTVDGHWSLFVAAGLPY